MKVGDRVKIGGNPWPVVGLEGKTGKIVSSYRGTGVYQVTLDPPEDRIVDIHESHLKPYSEKVSSLEAMCVGCQSTDCGSPIPACEHRMTVLRLDHEVSELRKRVKTLERQLKTQEEQNRILRATIDAAELASKKTEVTFHGPQFSQQRKYLPTISELIDRLSIAQLKEIRISEHKEEYAQEMKDIMHDIDLLLEGKGTLTASDVRAIVVLAQINQSIWDNESEVRKGTGNGNLHLTHGLNGIRNTAKNKIQERFGGRKDYKIDCLAAEFKDWEISWSKDLLEEKSK